MSTSHDNRVGGRRRCGFGPAETARTELAFRAWLRPILPMLPEAQAWLLNMQFGVTGSCHPPAKLAWALDVSRTAYVDLIARLVERAEMVAVEHMLPALPPDLDRFFGGDEPSAA